MKKIMIAMAVVCAAALAQAAAIEWTTAARFVKNQDGSQISPSSKVYLLQTDIQGEKGYDALIAALAADDFDSSKMSSWSCLAGQLTTTTSTNSKSAGKGKDSATATAVAGGAGEYEQHAYAAILFQTDKDGQEYYILSNTVNGKAADPKDASDQPINPNFASSAFAGKTWTPLTTSGGVPEPTSGLLLLLGVAGLALRRKHA